MSHTTTQSSMSSQIAEVTNSFDNTENKKNILNVK